MQIYLAPMEGITGYIVRNAFHHHFGYIDKYFTPFIPAAKRMSRKILRDIDPASNQGILLVPQLISNCSEEVLDMIGQLKDHGFKEVNLNLGCPSGTVVNKKRGSGMLQNPEELDQFLYGIFEKTDIPVSIKTRIGFHDPDTWPAILNVYLRYPFHELIIHPRLRKEMYAGFPHLDAFAMAYDALANAPADDLQSSRINRLCYNGDIWNIQRYQDIRFRFPLVQNIMVGRGLLARPYLAWQIKSLEEDTGSGKRVAAGAGKEADPAVNGQLSKSILSCSPQDLRSRLRGFCDEIYEGYLEIFSGEKDVCMHMKEIWGMLGQSFKDSEHLIRKLLKSKTAAEYHSLVNQIFDTLELSDF